MQGMSGVYLGERDRDATGKETIIWADCEECNGKRAQRVCEICGAKLCLDCYQVLSAAGSDYKIVCKDCKEARKVAG